MANSDIIDIINKNAYGRAHVMDLYDTWDSILKPEESILERVSPIIKNKKILDIGIGGGRTTKYLLEISKDYTGIDYSPRSIQIVRNKYPDVTILLCDARELNPFKDFTFDFILFSFNGIDYIPHEGRIKALKEIYRVLNKDGLFLFSTHNLDCEDVNRHLLKEKAQFNLNYIKGYLKTLYYMPRHIKMKRYEMYTEEYAIINDIAHGFLLLHYYIGIPQQIKQLQAIGFSDIKSYNIDGSLINNDTTSPWIHYLSKK